MPDPSFGLACVERVPTIPPTSDAAVRVDRRPPGLHSQLRGQAGVGGELCLSSSGNGAAVCPLCGSVGPVSWGVPWQADHKTVIFVLTLVDFEKMYEIEKM